MSVLRGASVVLDKWTPGNVLIAIVLLVWLLGVMGVFDKE